MNAKVFFFFFPIKNKFNTLLMHNLAPEVYYIYWYIIAIAFSDLTIDRFIREKKNDIKIKRKLAYGQSFIISLYVFLFIWFAASKSQFV